MSKKWLPNEKTTSFIESTILFYLEINLIKSNNLELLNKIKAIETQEINVELKMLNENKN